MALDRMRFIFPREGKSFVFLLSQQAAPLFFPLVGFQMVSSSFFQSIGMAGKAIFLSLTRQLIFLLPCLLILPHYWGTDGVWGSIPVADFIASITTGLMLGWQLKKFKTGGLNNTKDSVAL